jgi:hypothetical protein
MATSAAAGPVVSGPAVTFSERSGSSVRCMRAGTAHKPAWRAQVAGWRFRLASPAAANALAVLAVLLAAAVIPLNVLARQNVLVNAAQLLIGVPMCAVGYIVARRKPGNPIGWLLLVIPVGVLLSLDAGPYVWLVYRMGYHLPFGPAAVVLEAAYFLVLFVALPPVFLLFPDGELPSPRWRWVLWSYLTVAVGLVALAYATTVAIIVTQGVHLDASGGLAAIDHPSGSTAWVAKLNVLFAAVLPFWLVFAARLVLSWRRASGDRRQQLKWLMAGVTAAVAGFVISNLVPALDPAATEVGVGVVLPVCLGVAVLKYRLYDIDRIISRTLAYAIVTGLLVGVYAALVLLATQGFGLHTPVAVAAATLAAAALFNPVRHRVQAAVDRRFNRARYDADQTVAAFAARLKDAVDLDAVRDDLAGVVHHTLEPAHVSVWISQRG